jgi:SAM-dependent methyltransferase
MNFIRACTFRKAVLVRLGGDAAFLCGVAEQVTARCRPAPFERMRSQIEFPANLEVQDANKVNVEKWSAAQFDLIVALDVLEHVKDLESVLASLLRLLASGGRLVVSGPTENIFYRIGRRLSGPEYTEPYERTHRQSSGSAVMSKVTPIATFSGRDYVI